MYDKVKLWIDRAMMAGVTPEQIALMLDEAREQTDLTTGEIRTFGSLGGLKVSIYMGGVSVVGSFPKYLYGNNIYPLDRHSTREALNRLEDALHLKLDEAKVTGLEFGTTFLMRHEVSMYLDRLKEMPRLIRTTLAASTLYYQHKGKEQPKTLVFYDKRLEERAKGMALPRGFDDANLLRYELRYNGKLASQIGVSKVEASTLTERAFYKRMVELYQGFYHSIKKSNQIKSNVMAEIKTVNDAFFVFVARLMSQSSQDQIRGFLDELKDSKVFADRKNYSRLKSKLQEISTKAGVTETDELIRELDDEIKNIGIYV